MRARERVSERQKEKIRRIKETELKQADAIWVPNNNDELGKKWNKELK